MAIIPFKGQQQKNLIWMLLVLVLVLIAWFGRDSIIKPSVPFSSPPAKQKVVEINFEVLKNPSLQELRPFEEIPPFGEEIGRENPFLPY